MMWAFVFDEERGKIRSRAFHRDARDGLVTEWFATFEEAQDAIRRLITERIAAALLTK